MARVRYEVEWIDGLGSRSCSGFRSFDEAEKYCRQLHVDFDPQVVKVTEEVVLWIKPRPEGGKEANA